MADLPPLEPNAYLAWRWRGTGQQPMTEIEWALFTGVTHAEAHRDLVKQAAFARRNARLAAMGVELGYSEEMADRARAAIDYPPNVREFLKWADEENR